MRREDEVRESWERDEREKRKSDERGRGTITNLYICDLGEPLQVIRWNYSLSQPVRGQW